MSEKVNPNNTKQADENNGPTENRSCTDILCCLLFIANCLAFIVIFSIGVDQGKPGMIFAVWDSSSRPCGKTWTNNASVTHNLEDFPYLYFPNPFVNNFSSNFLKNNTKIECRLHLQISLR